MASTSARASALLSILLACAPRGETLVPPASVAATTVEPAAAEPAAVEPAAAEPTQVEPAQPEPAQPEPPPSLRVTGPGPLSPAQLQVLHGSPEDEVPERRNGILRVHEDEHYVSGNERTLDLFHPAIADVGGGYVGVGTDQGYLLVDWARSDIAWLIDYDPEVLVVHELYRRFFLGAATPEEFLALWSREGREAAEALLRDPSTSDHAEPIEGDRLVEAYAAHRAEIHRRLTKVEARMEKVRIPCYLTDLERYTHLREMLQQGRIRTMLANLLDDRALAGIAHSARVLEVPIRVVYLSNAEQYWKRYSPQYRSNVASLPLHEDAVVLRTLLRVSIDKDFHYGTQSAVRYVEWLRAPYVRNVYDITGRPEYVKGVLSFFHSEGGPEQSAVGRRWRAEQARRAASEAKGRTDG